MFYLCIYLFICFFDSNPTYKSKFVEICQTLFEYGLQQHQRREDEIAVFYECLNEALKDNQDEGTRIIHEFEKKNQGVGSFLATGMLGKSGTLPPQRLSAPVDFLLDHNRDYHKPCLLCEPEEWDELFEQTKVYPGSLL